MTVSEEEPRRVGLWAAVFGLVILTHVLFELINSTPPIWDMAYHQTLGWSYLDAWREGQFLQKFSSISTYYPPLYYLQEALILAILSYQQFLPLLANLPGLLLLSYFTFRLGERYCGPRFAWLAGILPLLFPLVAWTSRESLLDVSLSGWVAAAVFALRKSRLLQGRPWSAIFGLCIACGMLTKWTFIIFLFFPLCYALYRSSERQRSAVNLLIATAVAALPVLVWYVPNLEALAARFTTTSSVGTALENDPTVWALSGWVYYPRCLLSYYLYLPLFSLFVAGWLLSFRKEERLDDDSRAYLVWSWLLGGLLALALLDAKDPRYVMPLAAPVALLLVRFWRRRHSFVWAILAIAALQYVTVSFNVLGRPVKWAVADLKPDPDYLSLSREWVFYQTHYFDAAGPAHTEDWRLDEILSATPPGGRVAVIPELPRLNISTLELTARVRNERRAFGRLGLDSNSVAALDGFAYVIGKTGSQGITYLTRFNRPVYDALSERHWPVIGQWKAPDGSTILLYRRP